MDTDTDLIVSIPTGTHTRYSLRPKLYDALGISHILRNAINIVWKKDIMSCFPKLSLINNKKDK